MEAVGRTDSGLKTVSVLSDTKDKVVLFLKFYFVSFLF